MQGDKVGLFCGDIQRGIEKILVALDVSNAVLKEAADGKFDLIITHHPLYRKDFKNIIADDPISGKIYFAVQHDIAIYSAHTNLDFAPDGVSMTLAENIGVEVDGFLRSECNEKLYKLVIFIPRNEFEKFRDEILKIGVGHIGNYSYCSFSTEGEGTFVPLPGTQPFIGETGKLEKVNEIRLETIVPQHLLKDALEIIATCHPYQEPAFDIYPIENNKIKGGFGVVGKFETTIKLADAIHRCKSKLPTQAIRYTGKAESFVRSVAILGGSGDSFITDVIDAGVDVFIAGEIGHHSAMALDEAKIATILPGHFATEWVVLPRVRDAAEKIAEEFGLTAIVRISEVEQSIFKTADKIKEM